MVVEDAYIFIVHKAALSKYPKTEEDLFGLKSRSGLHQTYSGVYNFETITKIICGYKPLRIVVYCNEMHASTIVKIIFTLQMKSYRIHIHKVMINFEGFTTLRTMILRFWLSL